MFIIVFSIQKAKYQTIELPIKDAYKLLQECDNNFKTLVSLLSFSYGTLCLKDPNSSRTSKMPTMRLTNDESMSTPIDTLQEMSLPVEEE